METHLREVLVATAAASSPHGDSAAAASKATGPWRVIAASVCGSGHARSGRPCQDAHSWAFAPDGAVVAAVADGAGSAALGEVGASMASRVAVEALSSRSWTPGLASDDDEGRAMLVHAVGEARQALEVEAAVRGVAMQELATTLIIVAAWEGLALAAQVGDGAAVVLDADGRPHALTTPRAGEYLNETTFLTSDDALKTVQSSAWRGRVAHLGVLSDGLQLLALAMPDGTPHAPFFIPLLRFASEAVDTAEANAELAAFLSGPRVTARTDDDVTLLLAVRSGLPFGHG